MSEQPANPKPGERGFRNPPLRGPSTVHPPMRVLEGTGDESQWPVKVPFVTERIANAYFGHVVDGDHTLEHGVLYSVEGQPFDSLGTAIAWCVRNPKPAEPLPEASAAVDPVSSSGPAIEAVDKPAEPLAADAKAETPEPKGADA